MTETYITPDSPVVERLRSGFADLVESSGVANDPRTLVLFLIDSAARVVHHCWEPEQWGEVADDLSKLLAVGVTLPTPDVIPTGETLQ